MLLTSDPIKELEEKILEQIMSGGFKSHQKLLSERKLAKRFRSSPNRIHRALQRLVEQGYLYTKTGDGTYISECDFTSSDANTIATGTLSDKPEPPAPFDFSTLANQFNPMGRKKLTVSITPFNDNHQQRMWRRLMDQFCDQHPFIDIDWNISAETIPETDVMLLPPVTLHFNEDHFLPLDSILGNEKDFDSGSFSHEILDIGKVGQHLLGIPVFRIPVMILINKNLFDKYGIKAEFNDPMDLYKIGASIEQVSGDSVYGCRYFGFNFHASFSRFIIKRHGKEMKFDKGLMKKILDEFKPYLKPHHIRRQGFEEAFLSDKCAILPCFSYFYNYVLEHNLDHVVPVTIPIRSGGYTTEGIYTAAISKGSNNQQEAGMMLSFLQSRKAQEIIAETIPHFLSVRKDVLNEQKRNSPFPEGTILYDFDIRNLYTQMDPVGFFEEYGDRINTETGKYFLDRQSIEETIENLKRL